MLSSKIKLPGLDCGMCGYRKCKDLEEKLDERPELLKRCIHLSKNNLNDVAQDNPKVCNASAPSATACSACHANSSDKAVKWHDSLGREFDFYLEHFPEEPGPREIIIPHNPMITRELEIKEGDIMIGRPLGMSCGCPITHCGVAMDVDQRTGVMSWCVTGPLDSRQKGYKDLGYYIAEGYEGIITETRSEIKIGMRYYFQPRMCMLQWRHSGLVNYLNKTSEGLQIRLEGLWIG
jgi:uncharacterized Fe-S cluster-containing protein